MSPTQPECADMRVSPCRASRVVPLPALLPALNCTSTQHTYDASRPPSLPGLRVSKFSKCT